MQAQIVRTVPERVYASVPRGDFGILESYVGALRGARELVYLENQFLWSPEIVGILRDKLVRPPSRRVQARPRPAREAQHGNDDTRGALAELVEADAGAGRLLACTLYARHGELSDPVYVHAKVGIVDDAWLTVGSANLNDHSLFNDTEVNVVTHDAKLARGTRLRLWSEHLELPEKEIAGDPTEVVDHHWKPISAEQLERQQFGTSAHPSTRPPAACVASLRASPRTAARPSRRRLTRTRRRCENRAVPRLLDRRSTSSA